MARRVLRWFVAIAANREEAEAMPKTFSGDQSGNGWLRLKGRGPKKKERKMGIQIRCD